MGEKYSLEFINLINTAEKAQKSALSKILSSSNNKNVITGDKCLFERKTPYYFVAAGYHYYLGMEQGDKVATERLAALLKTTEFFEYISENDLAYDEHQKRHPVKLFLNMERKKVDDFRKYYTEYYGDALEKSEMYELFYNTNSAMLENQILNYDRWREPSHRDKKPNENFHYFHAYHAHEDWWNGHLNARAKFKAFMNYPAVYDTWKKDCEEINKLYQQGNRLSFSEDYAGFGHIMSTLHKMNQEEKTSGHKGNFMECLGLDEIFDSEEMVEGLWKLILHEGQPIVGYYGFPYIRKNLGDVEFILRTERRERDDNGEPYLSVIGCDTHSRNMCVWDTRLAFPGYVPENSDKMTMRVGVCNAENADGFAIVNILNADVLPSYLANERIKMQMVAFAMDIDFYANEQEYADEAEGMLMENGVIFPTGFLQNRNPDSEHFEQLSEYEDINIVSGIVKNLYYGRFKFGDEEMDTYIRCQIETNFGPLEILHTLRQVKEEHQERFQVGAKVVASVVLSGDVAIYEYENGVLRNEINDLKALAYAFEKDKAERLRCILADDCRYVSQAGQTDIRGKTNVINRLNYVARTTNHKYFAHKAYLLKSDYEHELSHHKDEKCLVLASDEEDHFESIVFVKYDNAGQISEIELTSDSRYKFHILENEEEYTEQTFRGEIMSDQDIIDDEEEQLEAHLEELIQKCSSDEKYQGTVFEESNCFFILNGGEILAMSNDASCSPRGGWFPEIVTGNDGELYYEWEGEMINLYDNICDVGGSPYEYGDIEEWIETLENLDSYIVKTD